MQTTYCDPDRSLSRCLRELPEFCFLLNAKAGSVTTHLTQHVPDTQRENYLLCFNLSFAHTCRLGCETKCGFDTSTARYFCLQLLISTTHVAAISAFSDADLLATIQPAKKGPKNEGCNSPAISAPCMINQECNCMTLCQENQKDLSNTGEKTSTDTQNKSCIPPKKWQQNNIADQYLKNIC